MNLCSMCQRTNEPFIGDLASQNNALIRKGNFTKLQQILGSKEARHSPLQIRSTADIGDQTQFYLTDYLRADRQVNGKSHPRKEV